MRSLGVLALVVSGCSFQVGSLEPFDSGTGPDLQVNLDLGDASVDMVLAPDLTGPDLAISPQCTDGVQNGTETAIDCGGGACPRCASPKACMLPSDCLSGVCNANACAGGLVAYYSFDEGSGTSAADSSGNGNLGTLIGTATWAPGKLGSALSLGGGANAYVSVADSNSLDLTDGMTISVWVTAAAFPAWAGVLNKATTFDWTDGYGIFNTDVTGPLCGFVTHYAVNKVCTPLTAGGSFRHIAITYDKVNLRIYLDGAMLGTFAATVAISTNSAPLRIGQGTGGYGWNGRIDELRIFNRALTATEVQGLFTNP